MEILLAAAVLSLWALMGSFIWAWRDFRSSIDPVAPLADPEGTEAVWKSLEGLEERTLKQLADLTLAISDGIARNDRAEKRVQKTVTSARRLVREAGLEHAGIEAESDELRESDGDPGPEPELQLMQPSVVPPRNTGIPGLSAETLAEMIEAHNA